MVSESRYHIPEGPPVPIPNTEVKLRRAEDTLPATARENRSAPTFGFCLQRRAKKHEKGMERLQNGSFPKEGRGENPSDFFEIIQVLFLPLSSSSRSTKYTFGTRSRGLHLKPFAKSTPNGGVAQLGEHLPCKQGVMGSNPIISTRVDTAEDQSHGLVAQLVRAPA